MGTIDNTFILQNIINHCLGYGKKLYCVFVDFKKAFDYVVRDILWFKLFRYGGRRNIMNVIRSMYENIKSRIITSDNYLSEAFYCSLGVRQGEYLSPFLFSIYLYDIEDTFKQNGADGININDLQLVFLLYADDIVVFAESAESLELQNSLNILEGYCDRWKLTVNSTKTKVIIFR